MKVEINPAALIHPTPIVLIGTTVDGKANYTTIGDVAVMGLNPPLVAASLNESHYSTKGIKENATFSINIPRRTLLKHVDACGLYSGRDINKESMFYTAYDKGIPYIKECGINLFINVLHTHQIEDRVMFIGEVTKTLVDENFIKNNALDLRNFHPILYGLDNKYYSIGSIIGEGYKEGKDVPKK